MSLSYSTQRLAVGHSKSHLNCRPYATLQSPFGTSTAALSCGDGSPYPPFAFGIESNMASAVPSARRTPKKRNAGHFPPYLHREDCPGKKSKPTPSGIQAVAPKKSLFRVRIQAIAARYLVTQQDQLSEIKLDRRAGNAKAGEHAYMSSPKNIKASLGRGDPSTRHLTPWIRQRLDCSLTRRRGETRLGNDSQALFRLARFGELAANSRA